MTNKTKILFVITGLIVCLIITLLAKAEAGHRDSEIPHGINHPAAITHVTVNNGTHWIIQTTYKFLKPLQ